MASNSQMVLQHWSTADVPPTQRLDSYAAALTAAVDPMRVDKGIVQSFHADVRSADLGPVSIIRAVAGDHRCIRGKEDIASSSARNFHLILNLVSAWTLVHRGRISMRPGDAVMLDSRIPHEINLSPFQIVHVKMHESWINRWVPAPSVLAGRVIPRDSRWGSALCAFMTQLSPAFLARAPLPASVIFDHIGALLALISDEFVNASRKPTRQERALRERIVEVLVQSCSEPTLVASQVATALDISTRTLHRVLATCGQTFGTSLVDARVQLARRMLESPLFNRISIAEVGRRAGFSDPSHFARAFKRSTGFSPKQIRQLETSVATGMTT